MATRNMATNRIWVLTCIHASRNDNGVVRLQKNVLGWAFTFDELVVVEVKPFLKASRILPKNVDAPLFREIAKTSGSRNRVHDRCAGGNRVGSRLHDLSEDIVF